MWGRYARQEEGVQVGIAGQTGLQAAGLGAGREKGLDTTGGNHAGPWGLRNELLRSVVIKHLK